jgi:hypothetical protein
MVKKAGCRNGFMLGKKCVRDTDHINVKDPIYKPITKLKWGDHRESWPHLANGTYRVNYIKGEKVILAVADPKSMFVSSKHIYEVPIKMLKGKATKLKT